MWLGLDHSNYQHLSRLLICFPLYYETLGKLELLKKPHARHLGRDDVFRILHQGRRVKARFLDVHFAAKIEDKESP
jgi:hypothetical protein